MVFYYKDLPTNEEVDHVVIPVMLGIVFLVPLLLKFGINYAAYLLALVYTTVQAIALAVNVIKYPVNR